MTGVPATRYTQHGDFATAYQVLGDGPTDLLWLPSALHPIDLMWDDPVIARALYRLATRHRLVASDLVGAGSSDPVFSGETPAMQMWADGIGAVLDAVGSEQASIMGTAETCLPVMLFAASHPERVRSLVLWAPYARYQRAPGYPFGMPDDALADYVGAFRDIVGTGGLVDHMAPSRALDDRFRTWWGRGERLSGGRAYITRFLDLFLRTDVRPVLESIQAPTLLVRRRDDWHVRDGHARHLVERIPDARLVELAGADHVWFSGDTDAFLDVVEEFLTGHRRTGHTNRVLATVLFTDIVESTAQAAQMGDAEWGATLAAHDALVERLVSGARGAIVKSTGDGVLATFDGPARAIDCAVEVVGAVRGLGLEVRVGLHTGEVEITPDDVRGIAVHVASRIMALAGPGEVLVSGAIPPLVLGSGLEFEDLGVHDLKGVPGPWTVARVAGTAAAARVPTSHRAALDGRS
jgi:class 3 adenylate cyclase